MAKLWLAQDPAADELPERDPLALLTGMLPDQQMVDAGESTRMALSGKMWP